MICELGPGIGPASRLLALSPNPPHLEYCSRINLQNRVISQGVTTTGKKAVLADLSRTELGESVPAGKPDGLKMHLNHGSQSGVSCIGRLSFEGLKNFFVAVRF